ncbi:MAG: ATP-dependent helicase HrpB [Gammaproteobacteria bacterium]|nr:ATP-dependent helicase HrpB [Gammaproteobacteria bacterium]
MSLPIDEVLADLLRTLNTHNTAILQAPPGAGKTTRVPLALLDAPWRAERKILMLEPRRLAARSAAQYMAGLLGEAVGERVGYRTRLDTRVGPNTRIEVVTEGILTRLLQDDPALDAYAAVLFDEFHERSLQADLGLALARESQQALRDDLRLLIMSATLDAAPLARLLDDAPVLTSAGRAWPVEVRYLPVPRQAGREMRWQEHAARVIRDTLVQASGSMLVFVPGTGDIHRLAEALRDSLPDDVILAPLYGDLAADAQDQAIRPAPPGQRKIVLATAIAETSLTIDGVRIVIDGGWSRRARFDPNSGMTRLETLRVSAAATEQRKGRAGRLEPGLCIRLWSETEQQGLAPFSPPEIRESDLAPLVLELARWGAREADGLLWLDPPPAAPWAQGRALLQQLQALDAQGAITPQGEALRQTGLAPRLAHVLVCGRARGQARLAAELVALLGERDLLGTRAGADLQLRLLTLRGEHRAAELDRGRLRRVQDMVRRLSPVRASSTTADTDAMGELLALGWPDRIARRRPGKAPRYQLSNGRGAVLADDDPLGGEEWLVVVDLDGQAREARVFLAAALSLAGIERMLAAQIETVDEAGWDDASGGVIARRQRRLGALVLSEQALPAPDATLIQAGLLGALRQRGLTLLPWRDADRQWQARVQCLHRLDPDAWPDVSDAALSERLEDWLAPYLQGVTRLSQLAGVPLGDALRGILSYAQQQALEQCAPSRIAVPTGSQLEIDYLTEHGPVLAVKLQEMFGVTRTPCIANGRIPLVIHLLSPARRPLAITRDLASFWRQAYPDVRKDMRGRYPKHPWPEDPLTAPPQRGVNRSPGKST